MGGSRPKAGPRSIPRYTPGDRAPRQDRGSRPFRSRSLPHAPRTLARSKGSCLKAFAEAPSTMAANFVVGPPDRGLQCLHVFRRRRKSRYQRPAASRARGSVRRGSDARLRAATILAITLTTPTYSPTYGPTYRMWSRHVVDRPELINNSNIFRTHSPSTLRHDSNRLHFALRLRAPPTRSWFP